VLNDYCDAASPTYAFKDLYDRDVSPPHPGEVLRDDIMAALGLTCAALARRLGVSHRRLANLLKGRVPVSVDMAARLGAVLGHGGRYWLGLQMQHDVWLVDQPLSFAPKPLALRRQSNPGPR
jgi:antitoxin HigA-1